MSLMDLERSYENEGSPYYDEDLGDSFRNHDDQDVPVRIRRPRPPMVVSSMTLHERAIHAIESADWDACVDLVATDPNIAVMKLPDHNGKNLLHFIASGENEVPDKTVLKIISNKPEALGLIDGGGNLPLHMAARNPQRTGMVRLFVQGFRAGVATKNANGELPLHVTAELGSGSEEIVKVLCDAYPKGIQVGDKIGRLPIHAACCNKNASVDVVRTLLSHHYNLRVNACKLDKEGNSPIHLAIKARTSLDVIAAFHDADESFIRSFLQPDNIGNLPIHSALKKDIDPQLIMLIINAAPFSGAVASCTSVMPICLATKHRFPEEVITALLEVDMPIELSMKNDVVKRQHGHSWWHIVVECHDRYLKTIKDVISKATSSQVVALARSLGPDNVTRIADVASPAAKELFSGHLRFFSRYEILTTDSYENEDGVETFKAIDYGNGALSFDDALEGGQFSSVRPKTNYGSDDSGNEEDFQGNEGKAERREVILRIFALREQFLSEANVRSTYRLSSKFVEEILNTHHSKEYQHILKKGNLFCIAYEKPDHTLAQVFSKTPAGTRSEKWIKKSSVVLKQIGSAIRHVHQHGLIHGSIDPNTVAKYGERWKLTDLSSVVPHGRAMNGAIRQCIPPESIVGTKSDSQDNFQREERKTFEPVSILKAPNYGGSPVQSASSKVTFDSEVKNQKKALEKNKERNSDREKKRSGLGAFFSGKKDKDKDKDKFNYISESEPESEVDEVLLREKDIEIQRLRTLVEEGHKKVFQSVTQSSGVTSRVQCTFAPERCIASPTWDAWAFGLLMVQLIIGKSPLLPNFDLSEGALLANLFMFDMDELRQLCTQVKRVAGQNAADLVSKLLRPPPEERPSTISKVLQHPYFEIRGHTPIHRGRPHASPVQEDDDEKVAETMHTSYASEPEKLPATAPRTFSQRDRNQDKSKFWSKSLSDRSPPSRRERAASPTIDNASSPRARGNPRPERAPSPTFVPTSSTKQRPVTPSYRKGLGNSVSRRSNRPLSPNPIPGKTKVHVGLRSKR